MTEKELKSLSRADLLELLVQAGKENEELKAKLAAAEEQLKDRSIKIENSGSIAEASLQLNDVFAAAQSAADQYLSEIKSRYESLEADIVKREKESKEKADLLLAQTAEKCTLLTNTAQSMADDLLRGTRAKKAEMEAECAGMLQKEKEAADRYWEEINVKIQSVIDAHEYLETMFKDLKIGRPNAD